MDMIELEQAIALVQQQLTLQTRTEIVPIQSAVGRVTSTAIVAKTAVPSFARSGMDGYAIYTEDTVTASREKPVTLKVIGTILPGERVDQYQPTRGTAVKIMTGAAIPAGYDAVVRQELTDGGTTTVTIQKPMTKGKNYGEIGEDLAAGQSVLPAHTLLTCDSIGVLASLGYDTVSVLAPIRVGLIATGNELKAPGEPLSAGQIYNSSMYTIASYIRQAGGIVVFQKICNDEPQALQRILEANQDQVDLFMTTGGVSVGVKDMIPQVIDQIGGQILFHFVNIKPGTPVMASIWQDKVILSLSGNPFASIMNFHLFYWPILAHFFDNDGFNLKHGRGKIVTGYMKSNKLRRFLRANRQGDAISIPANGHRSLVLHTLVENNCFVSQPADEVLKPGDEVDYYECNF